MHEKEAKLADTMRIMGLSSWVLDLSWFLTYLIIFLATAIVITITCKASFLPKSDASMVLCLVFLLLLTEMTIAYMLSCCLSSARIATIAGPSVIFLATIPTFIFKTSSSSSTPEAEHAFLEQKQLISILSPAAFCFGMETVLALEDNGIGATWNQLVLSTNASNSSSFSLVFFVEVMCADCILYMVLGILVASFTAPENRRRGLRLVKLPCSVGCQHSDIIPKKKAKSSLYNTMTSFKTFAIGGCGLLWKLIRSSTSLSTSRSVPFLPASRSDEDFCCGDGSYTPLIMGRSKPLGGGGVDLENVCKVYGDKGEKAYRVAINNVSLSFSENEITCLLGHNGAGKTTLMSIITGMERPSSGDAYICGHSVTHALSEARRNIGYCPQTDTLFESLTVREHLYLFARLKRSNGTITLEASVQHILRLLDLHVYGGIQAYRLSGGMKRRLCVGIAMVGYPKVLLLDEPTSGMDPHSRRFIWHALRSKQIYFFRRSPPFFFI